MRLSPSPIALLLSGISFKENALDGHFYYGLQSGVMDQANRLGLGVSVYDGSRDWLSLSRNPDRHEVYIGVIHQEKNAAWDALKRTRPCIHLLYTTDKAGANNVFTDPERSYVQVKAHLKDQGHGRIGHVRTEDVHWEADRERVFSRIFGPPRQRLPVLDLRRVRGDANRMKCVVAYAEKNKPDAMVCFTDHTANQFRRAAGHLPNPVAVVGFDDSQAPGRTTGNTLTTIRQDFRLLGALSLTMAWEMMSGLRPTARQTMRAEGRFIPRASTAREGRGDGNDPVRDEMHLALEKSFLESDAAGDLARQFGHTREYFLRKWRHLTGHEFTDDLNDLRLDRAALLLRQTRLPVTEVLHESGYHTYQNFSRFFKKKYGLAPVAYRGGGK